MEIVCPDDPDPVLRFATEELGRYLREAGGVRPRIVSSPTPNGLTFECVVEAAEHPLNQDAFEIGFNPERIKLTGGSSRAVLYAVYAFLEGYLGYRWFYPGEDIVPEYSAESSSALLNRLTGSGASKRSVPDFRVRMLRYLVFELGPAGTAIADAAMSSLAAEADWMAKNRLNIFQFALDHHRHSFAHWPAYRAAFPEFRKRGIRLGVGGHCMFLFMEPEAFAAHPDWFALLDGKRTPNGVFCTRSEAAVRHDIGGILRFLDGNPELEYFAPWPTDMARWCECDLCKPTPPADRYIQLARRIHAEINERFPHVEVTHFAYGTHVEPPEQERSEPGMTVTLCTWGRDYAVPFDDERTKTEFRHTFRQWHALTNEAGVPLVMHEKYARHLGFGPRLLPVPVLSADAQFFKSQNVDGFELPMAFMGRWVKGLDLYALARIMWDAAAPLDDVVDDYFRHYFGPLAGAAKRACEAAERGMPDWRYWDNNLVQKGALVEPGGEFPSELRAYAHAALDAIERALTLLDERLTADPVFAARAGKLAEVLDYAALEWRGLQVLMRGAALLVQASATTGTERDRLLDQAKTAFTQAAHLDEARQARASDPSLLPLHWDATGHGPHCVFRPGAPHQWRRYAKSTYGRALE